MDHLAFLTHTTGCTTTGTRTAGHQSSDWSMSASRSQPHNAIVAIDFRAHRFEHPRDACLAGRCQAPELRPSDQACLGAECEGLDDIGAAPDAAVHQHRHPSRDGLDHAGKASIEAGAASSWRPP